MYLLTGYLNVPLDLYFLIVKKLKEYKDLVNDKFFCQILEFCKISKTCICFFRQFKVSVFSCNKRKYSLLFDL